ncbi:hypothetical protein BDZ90DRAFT_25279 [Jaminaea rosea]|uniref:Uncharacterized protein n=1 Tax=Jaminaea rosea TaxID=1569628 RepID=A0A316UZU7_9BASI|nr:hypothetical protein BDZ90DRAFT_25279 [Jaminaea rosea]PWN30816.1 hypothetical protein BDZ90DRAFT_25279 [Jaminaea rosea]
MSPPDKIVSSASQYDAVDPLDDLGEALDHQLTLDSDLPNVDQLPSDVFRLQEMIRDSRAVIERRNRSLLASKDRLEKLSRSHDELLERSALWKDELETLQASHADVQQQLGSSMADNERLGEQIKDLRHTSEESRRAILRLQGERKSATGGVAGDRRSVAAGSLAGWNPSMLGGEPSGSGSTPDDGGRSSKRSTILFGAPTAASRRHTRSGSGVGVTPSSSQTDSQNDVERTPQQASSGGLRGLRLGFDRPSEADGDETVGEESSTRRPLSRRSLLLPPSGNANRPSSTSSVSPTPSASGSGLGSPIMDGQFLPLPSSPALSASEGGDVSTARASTQTFSTAGAAGMSAMQIMRLKDDELAKMQAEMKTLRGKLDEAIEGRRASDACLKALKEFIGEGGPEGGEEARAALRGVKLPPLPTDDEEEEGGAKSGQNGSVTDNWWSSVMRKASSATPAATNPKRVGSTATTAPSVTSASGPSSDLLSTSPSNQSNTSASGRSWGAAEASSPIPSSSGVVGGSSAGGLASFGSFFARSTSSSSSSPQPPNPPSKSPENLRPIDHRSYSTSSGTSDVSGGSGAGAEGVNGSPRRPANAALNRLSNWFSKPQQWCWARPGGSRERCPHIAFTVG